MARSTKKKHDPDEIYSDFVELLGEYIIWTSNAEMVFFAFLQLALRDGTSTVAAVWFHLQSTRSRIEMVTNLCRDRYDRDTSQAIAEFGERFKGLTRKRNFYCHAHYQRIPGGYTTATGHRVMSDGEVMQATEKKITRAACNEIRHSCGELYTLLWEMWDFIEALQNRLISEGKLEKPVVVLQERPT